MSTSARIIRFAVLLSVGLLVPVGVYLLAALVLGLVPTNAGFTSAPDGVDVYVWSNGVHADLIVPIVAAGIDWRDKLPLERLRPIDGVTDDLAFGWGDRGFYLATPSWSDLRLVTAVRALSGLDRTVLHVVAVAAPSPSLTAVRHVRLSPEQYGRLAAFIDTSFRPGRNGAKIVIAGAYYGAHDAFFEGQGHYSVLETCNEWTRRALAVAGVRVPSWSPFDKALLYQLPPG